MADLVRMARSRYFAGDRRDYGRLKEPGPFDPDPNICREGATYMLWCCPMSTTRCCGHGVGGADTLTYIEDT